jgi:hypothetical protein
MAKDEFDILVDSLLEDPKFKEAYDRQKPVYDALDEAVKRIASLRVEVEQLKAAQRWIPVEERLPDKSGRVLVWYKPPFDVLHPERKNRIVFEYFSADMESNRQYFRNEVAFWMPEPEPPEA